MFLCFYIVLCSFTVSDIISNIVLDAHFEMYSLKGFFLLRLWKSWVIKPLGVMSEETLLHINLTVI